MNRRSALAFVKRHGVVLESARGPVPNLAGAIVGGPIRGSWWGHAKGKQIFLLTRAVRDSPEVLVCRLIGRKITYVHRRLWPALVRMAPTFALRDLAAVREVHTARGEHEQRVVPFPRWVPPGVKRAAGRLSVEDAQAALGLVRLGEFRKHNLQRQQKGKARRNEDQGQRRRVRGHARSERPS